MVKRSFGEIKTFSRVLDHCCVAAASPVSLNLLGVNEEEYLKKRSQLEEIFCIYSHEEGS